MSVKVMFVCMGNICRSPTAHAVFRDLVTKNNLADQVEIASSGTHAYHIGDSPDSRSTALAESLGVQMRDLRAQKITTQDLFTYDYILTMDRDNHSIVRAMASPEQLPKVQLFLDYASDDWRTREVPDPYYGGDNGFETVFNMIEDAAEGLLKQIQSSL